MMARSGTPYSSAPKGFGDSPGQATKPSAPCNPIVTAISGPYSAGGEGSAAPMTKEQEEQLRAKMDQRLRDYVDSSFDVSRL